MFHSTTAVVTVPLQLLQHHSSNYSTTAVVTVPQQLLQYHSSCYSTTAYPLKEGVGGCHRVTVEARDLGYKLPISKPTLARIIYTQRRRQRYNVYHIHCSDTYCSQSLFSRSRGNVTHFQIQVGEFFWNTPLPKSLGMEYATIF